MYNFCYFPFHVEKNTFQKIFECIRKSKSVGAYVGNVIKLFSVT